MPLISSSQHFKEFEISTLLSNERTTQSELYIASQHFENHSENKTATGQSFAIVYSQNKPHLFNKLNSLSSDLQASENTNKREILLPICFVSAFKKHSDRIQAMTRLANLSRVNELATREPTTKTDTFSQLIKG